MYRKKIMILGASILQLPAIEKAKSMGLDVIAVDMNPDAIGFQVEGIKKEVISTIDIQSVVKSAEKNKIDGIMTLASDMPMRTVATVAEKMSLVGISYDTAIKATNKYKMREALKLNGVPVPMFYKSSSKKDFLEAVDKIKSAGFNCIIKPVDNSGSRGITFLSKYDQVELDKAYEYAKSCSRSGDLMVEEYMEGNEVSVETLSVDGVCHVIQITDKITTGAPYFVEMGHSQPCVLSDKIKEEISKVAIAANRAIGIENGPSHTEIKVTNDGPKVVELGARLGGDNITTHLTPLSTGVDMVKCCIQIALGEKPNCEIKWRKGSAIRYFDQSTGMVKSIHGLENAENIEGVVQVSIVHGVNEKVTEIKDSGARLGFVIASGNSAESAIKACTKALKCIDIKIDKC